LKMAQEFESLADQLEATPDAPVISETPTG
jgi:hypothetical protein